MADAYCYYVLILKIPDGIFWAMPVWFVEDVAADQAAYENWVASEKKKMLERGHHGKH